ncbi:hypothetical protein GBA52_028624 [Prunus armeniaca]|nr:hypothetical protein GBA52_028624 [Prunus armeniaca]
MKPTNHCFSMNDNTNINQRQRLELLLERRCSRFSALFFAWLVNSQTTTSESTRNAEPSTRFVRIRTSRTHLPFPLRFQMARLSSRLPIGRLLFTLSTLQSSRASWRFRSKSSTRIGSSPGTVPYLLH